MEAVVRPCLGRALVHSSRAAELGDGGRPVGGRAARQPVICKHSRSLDPGFVELLRNFSWAV